MKRVLFALVCAINAFAQANTPAQGQLTITSPPPPSIAANQITPTLICGPKILAQTCPGSNKHYYWLVVHYPIGQAITTGPIFVANAPSPVADTNNYTVLTWPAQPTATSYDVLKTLIKEPAPSAGGTFLYAINGCIGITTTTCNDANPLRLSYTMGNVVPQANAAIILDNLNYPVPTITFTVPLVIPAGSSGVGAGTVSTTGSPISGNVTEFTSPTTIGPANSSAIINLFSTCSGTQYLGADGACHTAVSGAVIANTTLPLKGNNSNNAVAAGSSDIIGLWTGCSGTQSLGADGNCHTTGAGTVTSLTLNGSATVGISGTANPISSTGSVTFAIPSNVALPGAPTTTTPATNDNSTKIATTAFVQAQGSGTGTVTTTGSPLSGNLAGFSGATSISNTTIVKVDPTNAIFYGADPTFVSDSAAAINTTIATLGTGGVNDSGMVVITPGTYLCNAVPLTWGSIITGVLWIQHGVILNGCDVPISTALTWVRDDRTANTTLYGTLALPNVTQFSMNTFQPCDVVFECAAITTDQFIGAREAFPKAYGFNPVSQPLAGAINTAGQALVISSGLSTGTGAAGAIEFSQYLPGSSGGTDNTKSIIWQIGAVQSFVPFLDNTYNIGSTTRRPAIIEAMTTKSDTLASMAHASGLGNAPTVASNACGSTTQGTLSATSTDFAGVLTAGTAAVVSCAITFDVAFTTKPACIVSSNTAIAAQTVVTTTTTMTVGGTALASDVINYVCVGQKGN